jgi:hypothetical protein
MKPLRRISGTRGRSSRRQPVAVLALCLAAGCSGSIGGAGDRPGSSPDDDPAAVGGNHQPPGKTGPGEEGPGMTPPPTSTCGADSIPAARTWRLTNTQFRNTALAVFGFAGPTTDELPVDAQPDGFSNQADRLSVPPLLASKYVQATEEIAANVLSRSGEFIKCPLASLGGSCLQTFLTSVGMRAWRRPLTEAETAKYSTLYTTVTQSNTPEVAFKGVVQALMLSPNFIFRTELGENAQAGVARLTEWELASAISYMLTDGPPDATLMELATNGALHDPAMLAAQSRRLLGGVAPAAKTMGSFFRQWLQFDDLSANKDVTLFPMYTPEVVTDLMGENQALIENVLFGAAGDHSVKTLMTATYAYVNSRTAPLYGVQASGAALVKTDLPAAQRRGVLTEAAFIAAASDSDDTNLPARGRIVREQALCETVAPPAGNFTLDDPKFTPDMTNREKFNAHTTNPSCAACHSLFDGIGFALEQYDAIGRFRTMDKKKTIDATGTLPLGNDMLSFSSYVDFVDQITKRPETYQCVAAQYAAFATGRAAAGLSQCESDMIAKAFMGDGYRLETLVSAIVTSPNFALRRN